MRFLRAALAALLLCASAPAWADKGDAFQPLPSATASLAATSSSSNVAVAINGQVRVYNSGSVAVFVKLCPTSSCVASVTADVPVAPGAVEIFTSAAQFVGGITSSGTATVYLTPGAGL